MEDTKLRFDEKTTKLSTRFMAGRGQVLLQAINKPLQAQEFAKRRKLQEMLFRGQINLEQTNIPKDLLPSNVMTRGTKTLEVNEEISPRLHGQSMHNRNSQGRLQTLSLPDSYSDNSIQFNAKIMDSVNDSQSNWKNLDKDFFQKDLEKKNAAKPLRKPDKSRKKQLQIEKMHNNVTSNEQSWPMAQNDLPRKTEQFANATSYEQGWSLGQNNLPRKTEPVRSNVNVNDKQSCPLPENNILRKGEQHQSYDKSYDNNWSLPQNDQQFLPRKIKQLKSNDNCDGNWSLPQNHLSSKKEQLQSNLNSHGQGWPLPQNNLSNAKSPWLEWEDNVIIDGSLDEEDLPEIVAVEDNDDIHDVVVNEYIDSLQKHQRDDNARTLEQRKLTPQRVQQYSKLKSTSNADCLRVLPGTMPNPPKGDDRWGGTELNGCTRGWGEPVNNHRNAYDDGSSVWSSGGSQYGGMGWSNAS